MNNVLPSILRPTTTCCNPAPPPAAVPLPISNPPGQASIGYRIGTFTSFRRAMLNSLRRAIVDDPVSNPFGDWHEGTAGDYQTVFIELWAYLADILTFYQERIANEAYLPTATQFDSLLRLVAVTNYRPPPGAGAVCLEAFTLDDAASLTIPAGFRTGNKPAPGAGAAVFETSSAVNAFGSHSAMPMASQLPVDQFAQLAGQSAYAIVLEGTATGLAAGGFVLIADGVGAHVRQLTSAIADPISKTTTITWTENCQRFQDPTVYALQTTAAPFGNNAPTWSALPASLRQAATPPDPSGIPYPNDWDDPDSEAYFLPLTTDPYSLFLDTVQPQLAVTAASRGFVVLMTDQTNPPLTGISSIGHTIYRVFQFIDARAVSQAALAISGRTTRLKLDPNGPPIPAKTFPLRNTTILTGAMPLNLATSLPAPISLTGQQLTLAGNYANLQAGQTAILQGPLADPTTGQPTGDAQAEAVVIDLVASIDTTNNLTTVSLLAPLAGTYVTAATVLMGNIASATQGETVHNEILGSGDGTAFQSFPLAKSPLTYLPANQADGSAAVESTLRVIVNGILWEEEPSLVGSPADAQVFTTETDSSGTTTVFFGDGFQGAQPPSGNDNVRARYRKGLGTSGNLSAGAIVQLIDSIPGVKSVTNPLPSSGGADPARPDQIRSLAPFGVRSFGRAVGVADYAAMALGYPGVSKASAAWIVAGWDGTPPVSQPHVRLTLATSSQASLAQQPAFTRGLRVYLDQRRDPNVPLRLGDYTPVYITVAATIDVEDRFPRLATLASVQAALFPGLNADGTPGFFAFDRLQFGEGLALATLYATIQAVPGVRDATITAFARLDLSPAPLPNAVLNAIHVAPTELITIVNNPNDPTTGTLSITLGEGGFIDT
jgi:hypothetical protein